MGTITIPTADAFPRTADVVVIGGGMVGVATAFWLSRAGLDTVLLEMRDGLSTLTTPNSIECFRLQFTEPAMAELAQASIGIIENFGDMVGLPRHDIAVRHHGYLFVTDDPAMVEQLKQTVDIHHRLGVTDSEFLDGDAIQARFPYISPRAIAATFRQNDGWFSTHEATQGFAKASAARFLLKTKATGILRDSQGVSGVETNRGLIATRRVINAAGPFAGKIGQMAGLTLPLEPVRRQKVFIAPKPQIPQNAPLNIDLVSEAYWRPETGGAYIAWVDPDEPVSEPSETLPTDWDFPAIVLEKLFRLFPFWEEVAETLNKPDIQISAGQYVYTPDEQPLIGPVPELPGFYLNCGYWAGVMLGPGAGQRVANLITGALAPQENALRPTRFTEGVVVKGDSFLRGRH